MISVEASETPDSNWNERLIQSGLGTINQTIQRGIHFERNGQPPLYLKFIDSKGKIVGQLLIGRLSRFEKRGIGRTILQNIPTLKKIVYFWIYGPIFFDSTNCSDIWSSLRTFLDSQNAIPYGTTNPLLKNDSSILSKNFQTKEWATSIIDLHKTTEELYDNIDKHSGRKNIERAQKRGVHIEEITEKSLLEYHELQNQSKQRRHEEVTDFQNTLDWWRLIKPLGYTGFLAKKEGKAIGGLTFSFFNRIIVEAGVARSIDDIEKKLYPQDLIKWKIIEWGVKNKMKFYDLAGFNPYPKTKKEEGIKRYKTKWGGIKYTYWIIKK
ncbi:MAG: hypothetical protein WEC35_05315 [Nitrosopumilaceae archaeon]